ncbi:glycosyltransferase [Lacticaseibacillus mingshuiensis]|uniref:glycosyltransferase n=1 Tax=Lacticaseibacillus mingshuiensis TaxID=2799574 RepID=UPI00195030F2|nr:glycosyltransferase [Lacticaseibacillus mingshuiensis]
MPTAALIMPSWQQTAITETVTRFRAALDESARLWPGLVVDYWLIDDGANNEVLASIETLRAKDPAHIHYISLSRHFGFDAAVQAGLANITADLYLIADLDQPHEDLLPQLLSNHFDAGAEVVGVTMPGQNHALRLSPPVHWYHYALLTAAARSALLKVATKEGFSLELIDWIGFRQRYLVWPATPTAGMPVPWRHWLRIGALTLAVFGIVALVMGQLVLGLLLLNLAQLLVWLSGVHRRGRPRPVMYVVRGIFR